MLLRIVPCIAVFSWFEVVFVKFKCRSSCRTDDLVSSHTKSGTVCILVCLILIHYEQKKRKFFVLRIRL